jgi:hypothetical protein
MEVANVILTNPIQVVRVGDKQSSASGVFWVICPLRWAGKRVLLIGHVATRWGLEHYLKGVALEDLIEADFSWREGWEFELHGLQ